MLRVDYIIRKRHIDFYIPFIGFEKSNNCKILLLFYLDIHEITLFHKITFL